MKDLPTDVRHYGHDPELGPEGTDLLVTVWADGVVTMARRRGRGRTDLSWGPNETLTPTPLQEVTG